MTDWRMLENRSSTTKSNESTMVVLGSVLRCVCQFTVGHLFFLHSIVSYLIYIISIYMMKYYYFVSHWALGLAEPWWGGLLPCLFQVLSICVRADWGQTSPQPSNSSCCGQEGAGKALHTFREKVRCFFMPGFFSRERRQWHVGTMSLLDANKWR